MLDHCYISRYLSPKVYGTASGCSSILTGTEVAALLEVQLSSVFWGIIPEHSAYNSYENVLVYFTFSLK